MNKKLILYWLVNILITILAAAIMIFNSILLLVIGAYFGSIAVIRQMYSRFEQWIYNVPKGYFFNCAYCVDYCLFANKWHLKIFNLNF